MHSETQPLSPPHLRELDVAPTVFSEPVPGPPIVQPAHTIHVQEEMDVPLPGEQIEWAGPIDEEIEQVWVKAHFLGLVCLCMGVMIASRVHPRFKKVAQGGWLRGWGWGFCVSGFLLVLGSIITFSQWPESSAGVAIMLMVVGLFFIGSGPILLHNGNLRLVTFLTKDGNAMFKFPKGCDVMVVTPSGNESVSRRNELRPVQGATATVVGHIRGRVAVKFHERKYHFLLSGVHQFLPKDGCIDAQGLFLPMDLKRIKREVADPDVV